MDDIDAQLVLLLKQNARQSSKVIARQLNVSSATVRRRLKRLIDSNELSIVAYRDSIKAGLPVAVLIGFDIDHTLLDSAMQALCEHPEVVWACTTTGRFDAFAYLRFRSNEEFSLFLRNELTKINGIKDSETFICLHIEKQGLRPTAGGASCGAYPIPAFP